MSLSQSSGEYIAAAGKSAPALAVAGATFAGMDLQDWVLIATLVYTLLQTASLIVKFAKDRLPKGDPR